MKKLRERKNALCQSICARTQTAAPWGALEGRTWVLSRLPCTWTWLSWRQVSLQLHGPYLTPLPVSITGWMWCWLIPVYTWHISFKFVSGMCTNLCVKMAETILPLYKFCTSDQKGPEEQLWKESIFKSSPFICHLCPALSSQPPTFW